MEVERICDRLQNLSVLYMVLVVRNPVLVVSDLLRLKRGCPAAETNKIIRFLHVASEVIILSLKRSRTTLIRLRRCTGWSTSVLFAYNKVRFLVSRPNHHINLFKPNGISHFYQSDLSISVLRVVCFFFFFHLYSTIDRIFYKQTVETLIRRRGLRHLIWVCTVCLQCMSNKKDA